MPRTLGECTAVTDVAPIRRRVRRGRSSRSACRCRRRRPSSI